MRSELGTWSSTGRNPQLTKIDFPGELFVSETKKCNSLYWSITWGLPSYTTTNGGNAKLLQKLKVGSSLHLKFRAQRGMVEKVFVQLLAWQAQLHYVKPLKLIKWSAQVEVEKVFSQYGTPVSTSKWLFKLFIHQLHRWAIFLNDPIKVLSSNPV